jgi:pseudomonalisin
LLRKRVTIAGALALAASLSCAFAQSPLAKNASRIDESQVVTLDGNTHPSARAQFDEGPLDPETKLEHMLLVLKPTSAQQADLDALVAAQQDPASLLYHQWLSPVEFGARFGTAQPDLSLVISWLVAHGFAVDEIAAGRRLVVFSGSAGQVSDSFHTDLHLYRVNDAIHIANNQDPQVPAALAGVVRGVLSFHDFRRKPEIRVRRTIASQPEYTAGSTHYLFPADFATIYDLNPLYSDAIAGAGDTIAIAGRSNIELSDVASFRALAGLSANAPQVILDGPDPGLLTDDQAESTLDVEWSGAVAPSASVKLVVAASTATTDGVDLASAYIVNNAVAPVMSLSYGTCEQDMGASELAFYNDLWEQAASEGISVFVASGDAGAAGCSSGSDSAGTSTAVNGLCSSPYSTCVGGTEFDEGSDTAEYWSAANSTSNGSALGYIPEVVWNESAANGGTGMWASGGGMSTVYPQPAWQAEMSGTGAANGMRAVPDVALASADHDGYILVENGMQWVASGTSVTAPAFAGLMALVIEKQDGAWQGNANSRLYALSGADDNPFHTTRSGNNTVPGVNGYAASGNPYNLATGLGSVDGTLFVNAWSEEQKIVQVGAGPVRCSRFGMLPYSCAPLERTPEIPHLPLEVR